MVTNASETATYSNLNVTISSISILADDLTRMIQQARPAALSPTFYTKLNDLSVKVKSISRQTSSMEEEHKSLQALAQIGQVVNSSLELSVVLQIVMDTIIRLTNAERGFLMLRDENGEMTPHIARNWEQETLLSSDFAVSRTIINRVVNEGLAVLSTNAQEDPRFGSQQSVIVYNLRSILCVPLRVKNEITGVIYADNRIRAGIFTQKQLDLLTAFANQAAVAIENARLFASVKHTLAEVTSLKNLMDNVFASIASGVLTTDVEERILLCNRAAQAILGQAENQLVGSQVADLLSPLAPTLSPQFQQVLQTNQPILGLEINSDLPERGKVDLVFSITPLKNEVQETQGVAIVMDDVTEKKKLEAQRRLFERMVSPAVIRQLNPDQLQLGGQRSEITVLFADIRGFTSFSETVSPEALVSVLNRHLAIAAESVLNAGGTIDKFLGDAVMAWFNAPVKQEDHAYRAMQAAITIRNLLNTLHSELPTDQHLDFGVGIHTGDAVLGLVGTEKRLEYTAIGDSVNTAKRIQENAARNQILISEPTYQKVAGLVRVSPVQPILAKGKREPIPVYELIDLI